MGRIALFIQFADKVICFSNPSDQQLDKMFRFRSQKISSCSFRFGCHARQFNAANFNEIIAKAAPFVNLNPGGEGGI
jgi:hypothetical protein